VRALSRRLAPSVCASHASLRSAQLSKGSNNAACAIAAAHEGHVVAPPIRRDLDSNQLAGSSEVHACFMYGPCGVPVSAEVLMNRMNPVGLGLTVAITTAVLSAVCAVLVTIAPGLVVAFSRAGGTAWT